MCLTPQSPDPTPFLILPPLLVYMLVQTNGTLVAGVLWGFFVCFETCMRPRNLTVHILYIPLCQLCFCRTSDRYQYLREKGAGAALFYFSGLNHSICPVLVKVLKHFWVLFSNNLSLGNCTNYRGGSGTERLPHCSQTLQRCFGRNEGYMVRSEMEKLNRRMVSKFVYIIRQKL